MYEEHASEREGRNEIRRGRKTSEVRIFRTVTPKKKKLRKENKRSMKKLYQKSSNRMVTTRIVTLQQRIGFLIFFLIFFSSSIFQIFFGFLKVVSIPFRSISFLFDKYFLRFPFYGSLHIIFHLHFFSLHSLFFSSSTIISSFLSSFLFPLPLISPKNIFAKSIPKESEKIVEMSEERTGVKL